MDKQEEIKKIEEELARTKYNKATQGHIGRLKAKLARFKAAPSKTGGAGLGYSVRKTGDATVILVGFPSVGKSTLLNALTNAQSRVGGYEFTTLTVVPGMLEFRGARIQLLDIPGLIQEASSGKGRGKEVLSVVRNADLLLIMIAGVGWKHQKGVIENELYQAGFRLNQHPPDVRVSRKNEGGLKVDFTGKQELSKDTVKKILQEYKYHNAEALIRQRVSLDQFIDCLAGNRVYIPAVFILNKSDLFSITDKVVLRISALKNEGVEHVKEVVWNALELKRVFLKKPGKSPDLKDPLIMRGQVKVRDICLKLNLLKHFEFARLWGPSARFSGQKKGLDHKLQDKDIVEIHN